MKVLVTGANGMLGKAICLQTAPADVELHAADIVGAQIDLDITCPTAVQEVIHSIAPDVIIHCAAYTQVDRAEEEPDVAYRVNALGSELVALAADRVAAAMCYISTDFVFDGAKRAAYHEYDEPNPLSAYARTKLAGELAVARHCRRHWIVRTAWLYGEHGRNFPATILRAAREGRQLRVVADQTGSPTYARDLARAIWRLIAHAGYGTYHIVNLGSASWYELARRTLDAAGLYDVPVQPIPSSDWPSPARRPAYSPLSSLRGPAEGLPPLRPWQDAVSEFVSHVRKEQP